MRWRDIRFEKPTEKDERVLVRYDDNTQYCFDWDSVTNDVSSWLPISELPQPDLPGPIPDGWRPVDKAVDAFDKRAKFWFDREWRITGSQSGWDSGCYYIVPIEQPKPAPQYRAFATWQEWWPHRDRWVQWGLDRMKFCWRGPCRAAEHFDHGCVFLNDDGTAAEPFGVLINS
jgi:hypothetical protein